MSYDNDTPEERRRVYGILAPLILDYASKNVGKAFHAEDLRQTVLEQAPQVAPSSPDRILRMLRQEGKLNYVVIDRSQSLYQFRTLRAE